MYKIDFIRLLFDTCHYISDLQLSDWWAMTLISYTQKRTSYVQWSYHVYTIYVRRI